MIGAIKGYSIAVLSAGVIAAASLHLLNDKRASDRLEELTRQAGQDAEKIETLRADVIERDLNIAALKKSRDTVNDRMRALIADNNAAVEAEVQRRKQAAIDRDRTKEALRIALDTIATERETDAEFSIWLDQPVPAAAWERLRAVSK